MKRLPVFSLLVMVLLLAGCAGLNGGRHTRLTGDPLFRADLAAALNKGGLALVAPASGLSAARVKTLTSLAADFGLDLPHGALAPDLIPYNANTDEARLDYLNEAFQDRETRVVWAVRGGYGSSRLLAQLTPPPKSSRKIFVGYSDLTFVHLFLQDSGRQTIHGAMFNETSSKRKDRDNFRLLAGLLSGRITELSYGGLAPYNQTARELREPILAQVTGGNLTCLAAASGTPWPLKADGRILFMEDVNEPGYKIDRLLTQLKESGRLKGVKAVVLGSFTGDESEIEYALKRFAESFDRPVFKTDQFGHGPKNYPLVFNAPASISPEGESFRLNIKASLI